MEGEISEELAQRYKRATELSKTTPPQALSNDTKLNLYGYFKQAEVGQCNTERPGFFDQVGRTKHDAWSKLGNMSKAEAMEKYIETVKEAYGQDI